MDLHKELNRRIFWDVNFFDLDPEKHADFVVARVFERGDVSDIRACRRYYGDTRIADILLNLKSLPRHRLYLASAILNEPLNSFRCFNTTQ